MALLRQVICLPSASNKRTTQAMLFRMQQAVCKLPAGELVMIFAEMDSLRLVHVILVS